MELLSKFENIKIENANRVPVEDMQIIEQYSREFEEYRNRIMQYELMFKNKALVYPNYDGDNIRSQHKQVQFLSHFYEDFMRECQIFINTIMLYFANKYKITINNVFADKGEEYNSYKINESEERLCFYKTFTYNDILDSIFEQLGGFDFNSKAEQEVKNNMKNLCKSYGDNKKITLSKSKITFKNISIISYDDIFGRYEIDYRSDRNLKSLLNSMNYFENGNMNRTKLNDIFLNEHGGIKRDLGNDILFQKHELNFNKIKSFKFFKNRRIDIEFTSGQYALEFARDYCGYTK